MSEQNILNPAQTSLLSPDWPYTEAVPETRSLFQAQSGKPYSRRQLGRGRIYDLQWNNRDLATKHTLQQWAQQYENDFFTLADWERGRYFSGRFDGPLTFNPVGNQQYNIKGRFVELPGLAMYAYPTNWARDAIFLEERNGFGEDLVKLAGTWAFETGGFSWAHGLGDYYSNETNATAEWVYFGYGFSYWHSKNSNLGFIEISATRVRDGAVVLAATQVDLWSATLVAPAAILTKSDLPLDLYRVKVRCTGTKNASSTGFYVRADAIEVMQ